MTPAHSAPIEEFRMEHRELMHQVERIRTAGRAIAHLGSDARRDRITGILEFLSGTLLPHARAEERVMYPAWSRLVGHEEAAASMVADHVAIAERVAALERASPNDVEALHELLFGLYALITVHFRKEEELQLPAFEARPAGEFAGLLQQMHDGSDGHHLRGE